MAASPLATASREPNVELTNVPAATVATAYGRMFWFAYASNLLTMVAYTLLYRYADFVTFLGGDEFDLGRIVGVGMIGSLVMRFAQGVGIDRYGPRRIWLWSLVVFAISLFAHLWITRYDGAAIYFWRTVLSISLAGVFGASITCVSRRLPAPRMAEVIGTLGTSGFIAIALGAPLGDWLCGQPTLDRRDLNQLFLVAAALAVGSLILAMLATHGDVVTVPRRRLPMWWLLRRYHPGLLLVMSVAMGVGLAIPGIFLAPYATELKIYRTAGFWIVYTITAFMARLLMRRFPEHFGLRPMIYLGMITLLLSLLTYLPVRTEWQLAIPGFFGGVAHALLFPSIIASGTTVFPNRYRGLGTTVMLAALDAGTLIGAPLVGKTLETSKALGLPAYPTTFLFVAALLAMFGGIYAIGQRRDTAT